MSINVRPLADRVVIKALDVEKEVKKGGIIIPDTAKEKPQEGEVVEVGAGRKTEDGKTVAMEVKKGDRVLYGKYSGTEVTIGNEEFLIMREADILAVVSNGKH
jgi:chaperonin GroES